MNGKKAKMKNGKKKNGKLNPKTTLNIFLLKLKFFISRSFEVNFLEPMKKLP
jgi:hypothetical protein